MIFFRKLALFLFILTLTLTVPTLIFASDSAAENNMTEQMTLIIFQLSLIIFAAWAGGQLFRKMKLPSVLGELLSGVIIGPFCLGSISFFGFHNGIFPVSNSSIPVSPELYSYATLASIILLFLVGLETNIKTLFKYSIAGSAIGLSGVVFSFVLGDVLGIIFAKYFLHTSLGFLDIIPLFMGVISTATSVGITARILSEKKKTDSPEGVTILTAAVVDDVLGIILLAVVIGIAKSGNIQWREILIIGCKAIGFWLIFTALGLIFAYKISGFLKKFKDRTTISIMVLALAMLLSGIFEKSGLAMIIGAYVMGLSLSKTDLSLTIQENLHSLQKFFIPIFFCIMGMLVDISQMTSPVILQFGLLYSLFAVLGKIVGCMLPAYFFNFNNLGALRIGVGMIPRGEVALIIVGIGLSAGILTKEVFSISLIMTFLTTLLTPPLLSKLFEKNASGTKKQTETIDLTTEEIVYEMPNQETGELILGKILNAFEAEGFFVNNLNISESIYQIRKDDKIISLTVLDETKVVFSCLTKDSAFVNTLFFEVLADLEHIINNLKNLTGKEKIAKEIFKKDETEDIAEICENIKNILNPMAVNIKLKSETKDEILKELVNILIATGELKIETKDEILADLFQREETLSTGMQNGLAFPHTRTNAVKNLICAIGVKKEGMDFKSLDGKPSKFFILTLAPKNAQNPYLKFISDMSKILANRKLEYLLESKNSRELYSRLFNVKSKSKSK